ncbi:hypothetical protein [Variovorax sp. GT1P44]|uniref:hypothetical protein n=1 Tax=Variovorax sp. GT1P44 TaxID=3443742 RepID=UPI003F45BD0D
MRFEDLPNLPLDTVGIEKLREAVRSVVTQCELAPRGAAGAASASRTAQVGLFFQSMATKLSLLATAQNAE